ncbi:RNA:NAD 2'-phosphotransferase [Enhygromyxa salina]|uniref:RNA:NAD 2'-phosphotransferase n=1 Tax=Enhygromyxa salina TaxID=215803 RepID=A0A0C2CYK2_9BACT|nr:RNA 2'-phosphotransferase [Enhygromyxa salina]KIG12942.1 RNA:NAD 2'-phosphotransferase [Enhygromyxa salina]
MNTTKAMDRQLVKKSKKLSRLLRHSASDIELEIDEAGWVAVDDVLRTLNMSRADLEMVVRENNKSRLQLEGDRVRACQGHSLDNWAVTREGLEASWDAYAGDASVWHGTSVDAVASIAREGILAVGRTHVHLAPAMSSKVGKRASVHVMLEISPARVRAAGVGLFVAPNGVVLAREIPASCVIGLHAMTTRAREREAELSRLFTGIE